MQKQLFVAESKLIFITTFYILFVFSAGVISASAQTEPPDDVAPPAIKNISQNEKKLFDSESSLKKRTKLGFELMDARLLNAEKNVAAEKFNDSLEDFASFEALMDYVYEFLNREDTQNRADNQFKNFEIYLRKQMPRIETIRREMPFKYGYYALKLMKEVRAMRAKAVEPLFAESAALPE